MMYGFWGEGHTSDYPSPIPDPALAERTFVDMTERQIDAWRRVPLVVNTQPDISRTGNRAVLDLAVRGGCWLRSDSVILDEPEQIEELAHRPPWLAVVMEDGYHRHYRTDTAALPRGRGRRRRHRAHDAPRPRRGRQLLVALDRGRRTSPATGSGGPAAFEALERRIGYRVRPSWVWQRKRYGDRRAGRGLRERRGRRPCRACCGSSPRRRDGKPLAGGGLDAGHPFAGRLRLASFLLPPGLGGQRGAPAGRARGEGRAAPRALGLRPAARRRRRPRGAPEEARRAGLAEGGLR